MKDLKGLKGLMDLKGLKGLKGFKGLKGLKDLKGTQTDAKCRGLKWSLSLISKDRPCIDGNARFTTVPLKALSDQI